MADHPTPFVSFTATLEGCSLTADIRLLRKLFPNDDGNAIFTAGEGGLDSPWIGEEGDDDNLPSLGSGEEEENEVDLPRRGRRRNRDRSLSSGRVSLQAGEQSLVNGDGDGSRRLLKCLQLDLSSFGLGKCKHILPFSGSLTVRSTDKTGIVNMLTDILTSNGINLLYSSTFATANILVSKQDLAKARSTLLNKI